MPETDLLTEEAAELFIDTLAERLFERLQGSVISSALPAWVGDLIREASQHGQRMQWNTIYLAGPNCLNTRWTMNADGTLQLELDGPDGSHIWRGTFRPAEA